MMRNRDEKQRTKPATIAIPDRDSSAPSKQTPPLLSAAGINPIQFTSHYALLRHYLELFILNLKERGKTLVQDKTGKKLSQFRLDQFWQFSQDIYDEMNRRLDPDQKVPFLVIRLEFPAKRNQARQKLATLQTYRFQKLAVQVMLDIERRYPFIKYDYEMELEKEAAWRQSNRDSESDAPPVSSYSELHFPNAHRLSQNTAMYVEENNPIPPAISNWRQRNRQPPPPQSLQNISQENDDAESDYKYTPATQFVPPLSPPSASIVLPPPNTRQSGMEPLAAVRSSGVPNGMKRPDTVPFRPRQHPPNTRLLNTGHPPQVLTSAMVPALSDASNSSNGEHQHLHTAVEISPNNSQKMNSPTGPSFGSKLVGWFKKKPHMSPSTQPTTKLGNVSPDSLIPQTHQQHHPTVNNFTPVTLGSTSQKQDNCDGVSQSSTINGLEPEARIRRLKSKLRLKDGEYLDLQQKFSDVQSSYENLLTTLKEKERFNDDVKKEANNLLQEIKNLALKNKMLMEERDRLLSALAKSSLSPVPSSNMSNSPTVFAHSPSNQVTPAPAMIPSVVPPQPPDDTMIYAENVKPPSDKRQSAPTVPPIITSQKAEATQNLKTVSIVSSPDPATYLDSVREALTKLRKAANAAKSTGVLQPMRQILLICKSLTQDAESLELTVLVDKKRIGFGVEQLTEKSISLMNATREHVTSGGGTRTADQIEQLGDALFDGAEELVEVMKACMDRQDETDFVPTPQPDSARDPKSPSRTSASSPLAQETKYQLQEGSEKFLQEEAMSLKAFTEDSSDLIAEQIQELLLAMRNKSTDGSEIKVKLDQLVSHVDSLVGELIKYPDSFWNQIFSEQQQDDPKSRGIVGTLGKLENTKDELTHLSMRLLEEFRERSLKQQVAHGSFDLAKHCKELLVLMDQSPML